MNDANTITINTLEIILENLKMEQKALIEIFKVKFKPDLDKLETGDDDTLYKYMEDNGVFAHNKKIIAGRKAIKLIGNTLDWLKCEVYED